MTRICTCQHLETDHWESVGSCVECGKHRPFLKTEGSGDIVERCPKFTASVFQVGR